MQKAENADILGDIKHHVHIIVVENIIYNLFKTVNSAEKYYY